MYLVITYICYIDSPTTCF